MNNQRLYATLNHKERESLPPAKRPPPRTTVKASTGIEMTSSNKLLAGYLAHEFRTTGTLLGQRFESARADTAANKSYKEITNLIMRKNDGGDHIPGIVNPAQLARWIQM